MVVPLGHRCRHRAMMDEGSGGRCQMARLRTDGARWQRAPTGRDVGGGWPHPIGREKSPPMLPYQATLWPTKVGGNS
eukprot:8197891-Pyramimonas_sp.AAC.1